MTPTKQRIISALCRAWTPPRRLKISEWAAENVTLPKQGNSEPGPWNPKRLPYQLAMLDDALDPTASEIVWMVASQLCKTLSLLIQMAYFIAHDPSSILVVYPTLGTAESWSKKKFAPFRKACKVLAGLIHDEKKRTGENTILEKSYPGGDLSIAGANSPPTLREMSKRIILLDEVDSYKPNAEGDPIEQADSRARNFFNAIKIKCSTPTIKRQSRIEELYELSDKRQWFCPCPKCNHEQTLKWSQVKWTFDQPDGSKLSKPEDAVYVCESCKAELTDSDRIAMICAGKWKATAPFNGIVGRHLNGLYRMIGKKKAFKSYLHEFVAEFLKVYKDREKLMVWTNLFLAETFEDQVMRQDFTKLEKRRENYGPVLPAPVLCLVAAADLQHNRIEVAVTGFASTEEAWVMRYFYIEGNPHQPEVWAKFAQFLETKWTHANGKEMKINLCFIDSGGQSGREGFSRPVYNFVKHRQHFNGCYACKGVETNSGQVRRESYVHKKTILLQLIGTDETKSLIYSRLEIEEPGPRYIHFRDTEEFGTSYFQGLVAEEVRVEKVRGFTVRKWVKVYQRNEPLDLMTMTVAALDKLNPNWAKLRTIYGKSQPTEPTAQDQAPPQPNAPQIAKVQRPPPQRMRLPRHLPFRRR